MPIFHWDLEQGSPSWFKLHNTRPTASEFDSIITPKTMMPSASRFKYGVRLVACRLMNWQPYSLDTVNHIMEGKRKEPFAALRLEDIHDIKTLRVGFVTTGDGRFGASPDRLADVRHDRSAAGISIEIKCPTIPVQLERLLLDPPDSYRCQVQGQLFVTEADKAIFYSFHEDMPAHQREVGRDEAFIGKLKDCLERFYDETEEMYQKAVRLGTYHAYADLVSPLEAERGDNLRRAPLETAEELDDFMTKTDFGRMYPGG